jgi:hypothetical protein
MGLFLINKMYKARLFFVSRPNVQKQRSNKQQFFLPRNQSKKSKKDSPMVLGGREHNLASSIQQP